MRPILAIAALAAAAPAPAQYRPGQTFEQKLEGLYGRPLTPEERADLRRKLPDAERARQEKWYVDRAPKPPTPPGQLDPREVYRFFHETIPPGGWAVALVGMVVLSRPRRRKEPR